MANPRNSMMAQPSYHCGIVPARLICGNCNIATQQHCNHCNVDLHTKPFLEARRADGLGATCAVDCRLQTSVNIRFIQCCNVALLRYRMVEALQYNNSATSQDWRITALQHGTIITFQPWHSYNNVATMLQRGSTPTCHASSTLQHS